MIFKLLGVCNKQLIALRLASHNDCIANVIKTSRRAGHWQIIRNKFPA